MDAIRRGAPSGVHALWSSGSDSNRPPSCGVLDEAGPGHGLGSPLRCQRVSVKFMRQHAVRVAGPDRIIFLRDSSRVPKKSTTEFHRGIPQRNNQGQNHHRIPLWLCSVFLSALCGEAFELARCTFYKISGSNIVDLRFLFGLYFGTAEGGCPHVSSADGRAEFPAEVERSDKSVRPTRPVQNRTAGANVSPQENNFGFVFQSKFQSSTSFMRVVSPSRWTEILLKITGNNLIGDHGLHFRDRRCPQILRPSVPSSARSCSTIWLITRPPSI